MTGNKKKSFTWHGKTYYYIGQDENGQKMYLEKATWDCNWYWGIGYIESFTNNRNPELSRDISMHTHFDCLMEEQAKNRFYHIDAFKTVFPVNPFTDSEIWKIIELMKSAYTARQYSDMLYTGGSHITGNPAKDIIQNETEYKRINDIVIPGIMENLYKIMTETEGK